MFEKTSDSRFRSYAIGVYYKHQKERARERNPEMKKVNYEQLINNAVKALIKNHLAWSGSHTSMPSRDESDVHGRFIDACLEERYTVDEWNSMSEDEQKECFAYWNLKFEGAAAEADRKWEAVKVMLDL